VVGNAIVGEESQRQLNLHGEFRQVPGAIEAGGNKVGVVETAAEFFPRWAGKTSGARLMEFLRYAPDVMPEEQDQIRPAKRG
jgi:hypothetical protein